MVIGTDNNIYTCQLSGGAKVYKISTNASSTDSWTLLGGAAAGTAYSSDNSYSDIALDNNNVPYIVYVSSSAEGKKLNVKKIQRNFLGTDRGGQFQTVLSTIQQLRCLQAAHLMWLQVFGIAQIQIMEEIRFTNSTLEPETGTK
ncbi:hypothetical protein ACFOEQ_01820 [Chryseobacterium arachidis]|uniref:hypothetical protein n=1 Tax=Chryseobacterium arachidis TaxID=1416778 RepID=UPI00360871F0